MVYAIDQWHSGVYMNTTHEDNTISKYMKEICKTSDGSSEYNIICNGIDKVTSGQWHVCFESFRKASNLITQFYAITLDGDIKLRS